MVVAVGGLERALHAVGLVAETARPLRKDSKFWIVDVGRARLVVTSVRRVDATTGADALRALLEVAADVARADTDHVYVAFVAAERLSTAGRANLERLNVSWFDARGHLHLVAPDLFIDSDVPAATAESLRVAQLFTSTGLDVGLCLLLDPDRGWRVTELAVAIGRSKGRVSELLGAMRAQGLVGGDGRGEYPALFWEVADAWAPRWYPLRSMPDGDDAAFLQSGTLAAAAWGAPVAVSAGYPPELYCAQLAQVKAIVAGHRTRGPIDPVVARIAHTPTRLAHAELATRAPVQPGGGRWPLAHPVVVALDLARDRARGREILDGWNPPVGCTRVW